MATITGAEQPASAGLLQAAFRSPCTGALSGRPAQGTPATFNARAETVAEKPMFRDAFERNRYLIPAFGYFEWQTTADGKQPYYVTPQDGSVLTFA